MFKVKMTKEQLKDWLDNLRSNKYKQGVGCLKIKRLSANNEYKHCCLGVLCEVLKLEEIQDHSYCKVFKNNGWQSCYTILGVVPDLMPRGLQAILMNKNDNGATFQKIADYIEQNVEVE